MQPQRVAGIVVNGIGTVLAPIDIALGQPCHQLSLAHVEQRAIEVAGKLGHTADALRACAPGEVHQHGFRLVVHVVRQCNIIRTDFGLYLS